MRAIKRTQLELVATFSIEDSLGADCWALYRPKGARRICVVHFDQSVRGWESERWCYFDVNQKTRAIYDAILASTGPGHEKGQLLKRIALKDIAVVDA